MKSLKKFITQYPYMRKAIIFLSYVAKQINGEERQDSLIKYTLN